MRREQPQIGQRFGGLVVVAEEGRDARYKRKVRCLCDCGSVIVTWSHALLAGRSRSCGCRRAELLAARAYRHGESTRSYMSPEYMAWQSMKARCTQPSTESYPYYGGRGIRVCDRWTGSFGLFLADVGRKPSPRHSLDRIDVNGDYEPGNVRWASAEVQANNMRNNRTITALGQSATLAQWSRMTGIPDDVIGTRLRRGWSGERSVSQPLQVHRPRNERWRREGR
jgi:hypothetical protein